MLTLIMQSYIIWGEKGERMDSLGNEAIHKHVKSYDRHDLERKMSKKNEIV